ncbi:chromatin remodelling complex protein [Cyclospora cayetanensis]|uniref:Chromatin remodelling complex protein n=1 Tax=Cyclospora cayetanensis TaxID=88456 RepID=A0A1D3CY10_9EIME|nr:chromatin remodelling complex protein [Cyclospora cayetanensis]
MSSRHVCCRRSEEQLLGGAVATPSDLRLPAGLSPSAVFTEEEDRLLLWGLYEQGVNAIPLVHAALKFFCGDSRNFFRIASRSLKHVEDRCKEIIAATEQYWAAATGQAPELLRARQALRSCRGMSRGLRGARGAPRGLEGVLIGTEDGEEEVSDRCNNPLDEFDDPYSHFLTPPGGPPVGGPFTGPGGLSTAAYGSSASRRGSSRGRPRGRPRGGGQRLGNRGGGGATRACTAVVPPAAFVATAVAAAGTQPTASAASSAPSMSPSMGGLTFGRESEKHAMHVDSPAHLTADLTEL